MEVASIYKTPVEEMCLELFRFCLEPKGFRAVDVDCRIAGRSLIRFFIEKRGEGSQIPVSMEDCAEVSRALDPALEEALEGIIPGPYDLEVSSPGLDRRLRLVSDFQPVVGEEVRIKLSEKKEPFGQNLQGRLVRIENDSLVLDISKREATVRLQEVCRANLIWKEKSHAKRTR